MFARTALAAEASRHRRVDAGTTVFGPGRVLPGERAAAVCRASRGSARTGLHNRWGHRRRRAGIAVSYYGESAPAAALFKYFGFTVENFVAAVSVSYGRRSVPSANWGLPLGGKLREAPRGLVSARDNNNYRPPRNGR